jgi:hypothetical protein
MDDQDMSVYEQPRAMKAAASEPKHNHTSNTISSSHQNQSLKKNRKKRDRDSGAKLLNQLINRLARSHLDDKPTKSQLKKMRRAAREAEQAQKLSSLAPVKAKNDEAQPTSRKTRSMNGMLPLGFDSSYLLEPGKVSGFMTNDKIRTWIMSVYTPHLKNWYHECLSAPANQYHLIAAQNDPHAFTKAILAEAATQHHSTKMLGPLLGEEETCPTAFHLQMKQSNNLSFIQHSTMVACLVVRDGQRGGSFKAMNSGLKLHRVAATLLTTVVMDLKTDMGYFLRLFLGLDQEAALS